MKQPQAHSPEIFYDLFAENYHFVHEDWNEEVTYQRAYFSNLIAKYFGDRSVSVLDCTCGIGTQVLGLAASGYSVTGTDISSGSLHRAQLEAKKRSLDIVFKRADIRNLSQLGQQYDVVLSADNALPHIVELDDLKKAANEIRTVTRSNGIFIGTIRDYDQFIVDKPHFMPLRHFGQNGQSGFSHQVWNWISDNIYELHQYVTFEKGSEWNSSHYATLYRALLRHELADALAHAGFTSIEWHMPAETGFYQPVVIAHSRDGEVAS